MSKQPPAVPNRILSAVILFLMTTYCSVYTLSAQTSGLPAPTVAPLTLVNAQALFAGLTGCGTAGYIFSPQSGTCVAPTGGMVYPGSGVAVSTGSAWGTSLAAPSSALVGISDTQTLTNKSIAFGQITGFTFPASGIGVGTTDTQTLTNKSIASTEISGLPTFPTGAIVGTTDTQTLTNKSIAVAQITGFTFPASGLGVGTTDTQTLTNKSIAGSEVNSGTLLPSVQASSETVTFSSTPTFSASTQYSTITITANVTTFTLASGSAGQNKTITFCQNATGGFTVTPPANVHGFMTVGTALSKCSSQPFTYDTVQSAWLADGPGVVNE